MNHSRVFCNFSRMLSFSELLRSLQSLRRKDRLSFAAENRDAVHAVPATFRMYDRSPLHPYRKHSASLSVLPKRFSGLSVILVSAFFRVVLPVCTVLKQRERSSVPAVLSETSFGKLLTMSLSPNDQVRPPRPFAVLFFLTENPNVPSFCPSL